MKTVKILFLCAAQVVVCGAVFAQEAAQEPDDGTVHYLEDITVTGTRGEKRLKDSPVVTEVITADEIENSSAVTVTEILDDYGIMFGSGPMGDSIQLQGMGEGRVLYLIDGKRISGRIAQRLNGDTLPLANVERIEIVRGPQSALYGSDGIGGVINIITKKPGDRFSLSTGISNSFLLAYDDPDTSFKPGPFENLNLVREQRFTALAGVPIGVTRNSLTLDASRGAFYLNERESASLLPEYYRGRAGLDTVFPLGNSAEMSVGGSFMAMRSDDKTSLSGGLERRNYIRADGYIGAELAPMDNAMLNIRLYDNYYSRGVDIYSGIFKEWTTGQRNEYENLAALEATGTYDGIDNFIFTAGVEGAYNSMDKYNIRNNGTFAAVDKEALFFQAEYFKEDRYSFILGLRGERSSQFGLGGAPKVSAMFHLPGGFRLLGGVGLGYRAPDFSDMYITMDDSVVPGHPTVLGNDKLKPEYALGFNLGLEYAKPGLLSARINGYYSELWNEITYEYQGTVSGRETYLNENVARSLRTGFDSEARLTLFSFSFVSAAYGWIYAYDRTEEEELHVQSAHSARAKLGLDHKKSGLYTYLQGRYYSPIDPGLTNYDTHRFILDFYAALSFAKHFKVYAAVDNLTGLIDPQGPDVGQIFTIGFNYVL